RWLGRASERRRDSSSGKLARRECQHCFERYAELMSSKAAGDMPIYGPMLEEGLYDPHDAPQDSRWTAFNAEAAELGCCLEACKQVIEICRLIGNRRQTNRRYTLMATPVYSLAEHTIKLHRLLGPKDRSKWPQNDQEHFTRVARSLRKRLRGPLK